MKITKNRKHFRSDTRGFSTMLDLFLFLAMVSVTAVILLPAITGNIQIKSVIESKNQKHSSQVLTTLLNGRVDEFEYSVAGEQMDTLAGETFNNSSIYLTAKKLIAGHELKHRTFADLAAESASSQWVIHDNGSRIQLNLLMNEYVKNLDNTLTGYLDKQMGDRYYYNFTVVWRPFVNVPVGGEVSIGKPVSKNAYTESTYITLPYHVNFTRKHVEGMIDSYFNSSFGNISTTFAALKLNETNRTLIEEEIGNEVDRLINRTIDEAVVEIVDRTMGPVLDGGQSTVIEQFDNLLPNNSVLLNDAINERINATLQDKISLNSTMSIMLTAYLQDVSKHKTHELAGNDTRKAVAELADLYVNNAITVEDIKDRITAEIFSRVSISRAKVTLSLWEKNA